MADRRAILAALWLVGCPARQEPIAAEPAPSASVPGGAAPAQPAREDGGVGAPEALSFAVACAGRSPMPTVWEPARACRIRGRVRAVRPVEVAANTHTLAHVTDPAWRVRAIELRIEPDDTVPCQTPLDPDEKEQVLPEAGALDLDRSGLIHVLGGERIAGALREGARLCGWTRLVQEPGLGYPMGWEGELADGSGTLLGASSFSFARERSLKLARAWRFSREGPADRMPLEEGGAFVRHHRVRVHHGGAGALSVDGLEAVLHGRDGTFAVTATSDLSEGPVPIYAGPRDRFRFSAVRIDRGGRY